MALLPRPSVTLHSLHRRVHQSAQQGAEGFALAGALRHKHGEQLFLWIDPEERSGDPAPEELADRAREWRHALLGSDRKTQTEAVAGRQERRFNLHLGAEVVGGHQLQRLAADDPYPVAHAA